MLNKGNLLGNNFIFPSNIKYRKHHKNKILIKFVLVILIICLDIIFYLRKLRVESIINIDNKTQNISLINQENNWEKITNNTNHEINNTKKRIGVISVENDQNPGNTLVKFSMSTKLKELGFDPTIIALTNKRKNYNLTYLRKIVKLKEIKFSFYELKQNEYDILMVNSDQTWTYNIKKNFYDIAFLQFAYNWKIPKFVYGASMGTKHWRFNSYDDMQAKKLLKNFTGISLRENMLVPLAAEHLGINASFVLDPTFLIDKNYYLDLIKNYNRDFDFSKKYVLVHQLSHKREMENFINEVKEKLDYTIYYVNRTGADFVQNFLFGINVSQSVITDSYHGTVFSIIFNKPFITFINNEVGKGRFLSLNKIFDLGNRIILPPFFNNSLNLLSEPLNINRTSFYEFRNSSISFLKKSLGI